MNMIEVKTAELSGPALDWAVGVAVKHESVELDVLVTDGEPLGVCITASHVMNRWQPSADWSQGGPLIDEYAVEFEWVTDATIRAFSIIESGVGFGPGHLIAACRAICAAKLGDTVQIPAELLP